MILIEAARITEGGGGVLCRYLVTELKRRDVAFRIVVGPDFDLPGIPETYVVREIVTLWNRGRLYRKWLKTIRPDSLFCFGNFPPVTRFKGVRTITYFHRLTLTQNGYQNALTLRQNFSYFLRKLYTRKLLRNTDEIMVQTAFSAGEVIKAFGFAPDKIGIYPFYDRQLAQRIHAELLEKNEAKIADRFIYVSNDAPHKNHSILLDAWELLAGRGYHPELYLTLPTSSVYDQRITEMQRSGIRIKNIGVNSLEDTLRATYFSAYVVYPSLFESLGLGLVEGVSLGCKVIAVDLPYVHASIKPTAFFDESSLRSIADVIENVLLAKTTEPSEIRLPNRISELIDCLAKGSSLRFTVAEAR